MRAATTSYRKTIVASSVAALATIAATISGQTLMSAFLPISFMAFPIALGWLVATLLLLVALGGLLVTFRYSGRERGRQDLFLTLNRTRSEAALLDRAVRPKVMFRSLRRWLGTGFVVGDTVRIGSLQEILDTLDADGCLDGLPFMPEMAKYCGTVGTVFRCVDKIYDYGGKKDMRRMKDTVSIAGLRCDGSAHDGCQAKCYILWKTAWIKRTGAQATSDAGRAVGQTRAVVSNMGTDRSLGPTFVKDDNAVDGRYVCQFTELVRASTRMRPSDPRLDLRPLITSNVTAMAFGVAMLTRLFNAAQRLRGGTGFPPMSQNPGTVSRRVDLNLQPGELVRVCDPEKIFDTLAQSGRNRGLWFDREMLRHCKLCYRVLGRIDKIIDDASGRMLQMKTPCIVLDGVDASGEYMRFCAQHDYPLWREAWLERTASPTHPDPSSPNDGLLPGDGRR